MQIQNRDLDPDLAGKDSVGEMSCVLLGTNRTVKKREESDETKGIWFTCSSLRELQIQIRFDHKFVFTPEVSVLRKSIVALTRAYIISSCLKRKLTCNECLIHEHPSFIISFTSAYRIKLSSETDARKPSGNQVRLVEARQLYL